MSDPPNHNMFRSPLSADHTQPSVPTTASTSISTTLLSHPPSRLSPRSAMDIADILGHPSAAAGPSKAFAANPSSNSASASASRLDHDGSGQGQGADSKKRKEDKETYAPKRGYRACVHCRLRKARCDLGDVNAPSEPPCTRCRREQRDCVFLPSKRRRRTTPSLKEELVDPSQAEIYPVHSGPADPGPSSGKPPSCQTMPSVPEPGLSADWSSSHLASITPHAPVSAPSYQPLPWGDSLSQPTFGDEQHHPPAARSQAPLPTLPLTAPSQSGPHSGNHVDTTTPGSLGESSAASTSALSPGHRSKKRRTEPEGTRTIVNASLSNEMDALEILANAATDGDGDDQGVKAKRTMGADAKRVAWNLEDEEKSPVREMSEFHLIKLGVLDEKGLRDLVDTFFLQYHPSLPIFQTARIPRTREQLLDLAHNDSFLLTCMVAVASRHPSDLRFKDVHDRTWAILRDTMADYSFAGLPGSVGFVEGVLLLAEHLPREKATPPKENSVNILCGPGTEAAGVHGTDNRRIWALTGLAIRSAYLLGLDQIALEINEGERTQDVERVRSVWTWCYLYDRTIGLAFWSRGPSLCFVGYSHISQTGEAAARINFPLQLSPGADSDDTAHDDSASLMQALVELTQIMTNAHDILYPSKTRTAVLVRQGEYFLFLDHFRRALDSYRTIWKPKKWSNPTLREVSWMTYQYVRLYISSFGYSAHVKRAQWRAEDEAKAGRDATRQVQLFPRGSATSPDAIYIYESISAANEIMHIALRLAQMGSLRFLPARYLINISYAAVFALKSSYSGAITGKDMSGIRELVDHVCAALALACPDKDHPAVRYGQMLRMLSKKLEQLSDASAVPSRFASPEPMSDNANANLLADPSPIPWTLPVTSTEPPPFHFSSYPDLSFPSNSLNLPNGQFLGTGNGSAGLGYGLGTHFNNNNGAGGGDGIMNNGIQLNSNEHHGHGGVHQHQQHQQNIQESNSAGINFSFSHTPGGGGIGNGLSSNSNNINNDGSGGGIGVGINNQEGLFDLGDANFDFDLRGFFDDFALGEGSGFPFR